MTVFGDPLGSELLSVANVIFFLFLSIFSFRLRKRYKGWQRFLVMLMGFIGLYWSGIYTFVFFTPSTNPLINPVQFGQIFIRPMFTFMAAVMAAIAVYRWRSGYKP